MDTEYDICLFTEMSFPYEIGGVSTAIEQFLKIFKNQKIALISICNSELNEFSYSIPEHVDFFSLNLKKKTPLKKNLCFLQKRQKLLPLYKSLFSQNFSQFEYHLEQNFEKDILNAFSFEEIWDCTNYIIQKQDLKKPFHKIFDLIFNLIHSIVNIIKFNFPSASIYHSFCAGHSSLAAFIASSKHNTSFSLEEHGLYLKEREQEITNNKNDLNLLFIKNYFRNLTQLSYKKSKKIFYLNQESANFQISLGAQKHQQIQRFNASPLTFIKKNQKQDKFCVAYVGRIVKEKNIDLCLNIFHEIQKKKNNIHFKVIGPLDKDSPHTQHLLQKTKDLKLTEKVSFTGSLQRNEIFNGIDCLLITSKQEVQPFVIIEAMANGVPIIASNVGDNEFLIKNKSFYQIDPAGHIVYNFSKYEFARKIIDLSNHSEQSKQFSSNGLKRHRKIHSIDRLAQTYNQVFELGTFKWQE